MAKISSRPIPGVGDGILRSDYLDSIVPPADCSYFEEMCWRAEHETDPENRAHAAYEVQRMTDANNDALEEDRMNDIRGLLDHMNEEVGNLFEGIHFNSNDDLTRLSVRSHMGGLMQGLMNARHIYDYKIVCDDTNNPQSVIDRHELKLVVVFKDKFAKIFHLPYTKTGLAAAIDVDVNVGVNSGSSRSNPVYGANSSGGYSNVSVNGGGAIGHMVGQISAGGGSYILSSAPLGSISLQMPEQKQTADLPSMVWDCRDENGTMIHMELKPEGTISASDSLKIMMLIQASTSHPLLFSPYMYIKKHNLERHFKFSV